MLSQSLKSACQQFVSKRLFYPSSGPDFLLPIQTFYPFIDEFWFVDTSYRMNSPLLEHDQFEHVEHSKSKICGKTMRSGTPFTIASRHDTYIHRQTNRRFTVNKCCGRGYDLFRAAFRIPSNKLSVFFYRGDSPAEGGGSGFYWLRRPILEFVVGQLDPEALIVSDGSHAIEQFSRFHRNSDIRSNAEQLSEPFSLYSRNASCVGYLGERYGPTLTWRLIAE